MASDHQACSQCTHSLSHHALQPSREIPTDIVACWVHAGGLPIDRVVRYATQILSGLVELHARNITVMDLKPHNLLLDADLDELVITDFGLSKVIDTDFQQTVARGTPAYM